MVERLKVTFSGFLADGNERFAFGVHYGPITISPTSANMTAWALAIEGVLSSHQSDAWLVEMGDGAAIDSVNVLGYPSSGPATSSATEGISPVRGGDGTPTLPPQISRVVSLLTEVQSRRTRGRVYIPCQTGPVNLNGRSSVPSNYATQFADFLLDVGAAYPGGDDVVPVVYSSVADELTVVNRVRVGDVLDTQRRRSQDLVETYQTATV